MLLLGPVAVTDWRQRGGLAALALRSDLLAENRPFTAVGPKQRELAADSGAFSYASSLFILVNCCWQCCHCSGYSRTEGIRNEAVNNHSSGAWSWPLRQEEELARKCSAAADRRDRLSHSTPAPGARNAGLFRQESVFEGEASCCRRHGGSGIRRRSARRNDGAPSGSGLKAASETSWTPPRKLKSCHDARSPRSLLPLGAGRRCCSRCLTFLGRTPPVRCGCVKGAFHRCYRDMGKQWRSL